MAERVFADGAFNEDGSPNIPSQAYADYVQDYLDEQELKKEFRLFEETMATQSSLGQSVNPPGFGTTDIITPRADPVGYVPQVRPEEQSYFQNPAKYNQKPFDNAGFDAAGEYLSTAGQMFKNAATGQGVATMMPEMAFYPGGPTGAQYVYGGAADVGLGLFSTIAAVFGGTAGFVAEQVPFQNENSENRLSRELMAVAEWGDTFLTPYAGLFSKIAAFSKGTRALAPYEAGRGVNVVRGGPKAAGNIGPSGKPLTAVLPDGRRIESREIGNIARAEQKYLEGRGLPIESEFDVSGYPELNETRAKLIAAAYEQMKNDPTNPAVRRSYEAMVEETMDQLRGLEKSGIDFRFATPDRPYPYEDSPAEGYDDILRNRRLYVFPTEEGYGTGALFDTSGNPLLRPVGRVGDKDDAVANDAFRVVHDAYGHFGPGNPQFRSRGEERAWLRHSRMYSPDALGAMTSETRGQNSWVNSGPYAQQNRGTSGAKTVYADQKAGLMPDWTYDPEGLPDGAELRRLIQVIRDWKFGSE